MEPNVRRSSGQAEQDPNNGGQSSRQKLSGYEGSPSLLTAGQDRDRPVEPAGATSRRRRSSAYDTVNGHNISASNRIPTAPEPPKSTAIFFPPFESNEGDLRNPDPFSGSFAQRAALLTGKDLPPNPSSTPRAEINSRPTNKGRRTSLNRPIGGVYSEIQSQRRDSWSAGNSPTYPKRMSIPTSPQAHQNEVTRSSNGPTKAPVEQSRVSPPSEIVHPRRASTMSSRGRSEKWATDRSPLQNLELKLSDISKEEKRARVEQAEQELRQSKITAQQNQSKAQEDNQANIARRVSAGQTLPRPSGPRELVESGKGSAAETARRNSRASRLPKPIPIRDSSRDRGTTSQSRNTSSQSATKRVVNTEDSESVANQRPRSTSEDADSTQRATARKQIPAEQKNLYGSRAQASPSNDRAEAYSGGPDIGPEEPVVNARSGPKHRIPPQTAAGVQARRKVGFDNDVSSLTDDTNQNAKSLDELRGAGVARLTDQDFVDEPVNEFPWWENQASRSRRRSQRGSLGAEDPYPEGNGKHKRDDSPTSNFSATAFDKFHTRPYRIMSVVDKRHFLSALKTSASLRSSRSPKKRIGSISEYSYSCPSLADHDIAHPDHICEPYLSKELTQSMRSIRIRPVPVSTTFNPPIYLKCGPLLRYTGMNRQSSTRTDQLQSDKADRELWRGSVMIVTSDADSHYEPAPVLRLFPEPMEKLPPTQQQANESENHEDLPHHYLDPIAGMPKLSRTGKTIYVKPVDDLEHGKDLSHFETNDDGLFEDFRSAAVPTAYGTPDYRPGQAGPSPRQSRQKPKQKKGHRVRGVRLHAERGVTFWRFNLEVELQQEESRIAYSINNGPAVGFWVPARGQTMNIMFHSCNGFSLSVNPDEFSGPDPLWRDVLNSHQAQPFHVMIGGGDQIYNDAVMRQSPLLGEWLDIKNPHHKHEAAFSAELLEELETFYLERYSMWFSQGLFGMANAQIPMINIWDDHDIIDGFGSYPHHFMSTPVFSGLGAVAFKYYMLFQHQSVPAETATEEPSWLLGATPGPYIHELSRSVFMSLGKRVAFLGLDCRTERMREEVMSEATYDIVFDRCRKEIIKGQTKHLVVLLGVPIAYPRLVWLENVLTSRALDPVKAMGRMGMLGNLLNKFDGGVEILDDLDDHWTAKNHKQERNWFIQELQEIAADLSVRVTILGGDVHLAAVGQFFSNPKLKLRKDRDHRYMPNIISSAIVNTPPPEMMSDILNKRNKTHHLDPETDENMIPMFSHDVDGKHRNNKRLLPRRNWCSIRQYEPGSTPPATPELSVAEDSEEEAPPRPNPLQRTLSLTRGEIRPRSLIRMLSGKAPEPYMASKDESIGDSPKPSKGLSLFKRRNTITKPYESPQENSTVNSLEQEAPARPTFLRRPTNSEQARINNDDADDLHGHINVEYGLDIALNCEIDQRDPAGATTPYRLLIPALFYEGEADENTARLHRPNLLERINSLRGTRDTKVARSQGQGYWGRESREESDISDITDELSEQEKNVKPRRWSFGLERRRIYRDQSPTQRDPRNEAQRLGELQERPRAQEPAQRQQPITRYEETSPPSTRPDADYNVPPARHANRFRTTGDNEIDDMDGSADGLDSMDYHAHVDSGVNRQTDGVTERRLSKAEKMLGVADDTGNLESRRRTTMPLDRNRNEDYRDSRRSSGYDGIDAYPGKEKGWRRSLRLFS